MISTLSVLKYNFFKLFVKWTFLLKYRTQNITFSFFPLSSNIYRVPVVYCIMALETEGMEHLVRADHKRIFINSTGKTFMMLVPRYTEIMMIWFLSSRSSHCNRNRLYANKL